MRNFFVALAVFIIIVVGLGTVVTRIFRKPAPAPTAGQTVKQEKFSDKATKVRLINDGAIIGLENRRSIRITIDQTERTVEILGGYNEEVLQAQTFSNDAAAFKKFLIALDTYGYSRENTKVSKDEGGTCPLGLRYIYEATYKSGEPLRSWSSSCSRPGRLQGNASGIQQLFKSQIPGYNKLTAGVNLTRP